MEGTTLHLPATVIQIMQEIFKLDAPHPALSSFILEDQFHGPADVNHVLPFQPRKLNLLPHVVKI
jgi:hypothetical protein